MARQLAVACLVYGTLVIQPGVTDDLAFGSLRPWMPGIAVVVCALTFEGPAALLWAGVLGLGVDCQSVERPGIHLMIATLTAGGLISVRPDNRSLNMLSIGLFVFGASFVWRMAASIVHALLDRHRFSPVDFALSASWDGFSTAILVTIFVLVWRGLRTSIRSERQSAIQLDNRWSMLSER